MYEDVNDDVADEKYVDGDYTADESDLDIQPNDEEQEDNGDTRYKLPYNANTTVDTRNMKRGTDPSSLSRSEVEDSIEREAENVANETRKVEDSDDIA